MVAQPNRHVSAPIDTQALAARITAQLDGVWADLQATWEIAGFERETGATYAQWRATWSLDLPRTLAALDAADELLEGRLHHETVRLARTTASPVVARVVALRDVALERVAAVVDRIIDGAAAAAVTDPEPEELAWAIEGLADALCWVPDPDGRLMTGIGRARALARELDPPQGDAAAQRQLSEAAAARWERLVESVGAHHDAPAAPGGALFRVDAPRNLAGWRYDNDVDVAIRVGGVVVAAHLAADVRRDLRRWECRLGRPVNLYELDGLILRLEGPTRVRGVRFDWVSDQWVDLDQEPAFAAQVVALRSGFVISAAADALH